jgi:hypothetical protein
MDSLVGELIEGCSLYTDDDYTHWGAAPYRQKPKSVSDENPALVVYYFYVPVLSPGRTPKIIFCSSDNSTSSQ